MARLPRVLRSDNGPEFKNELLTTFLNKFAQVSDGDGTVMLMESKLSKCLAYHTNRKVMARWSASTAF
jgi:hypothetical protein